jgi:predicted transport protein
VRKFKPDLLKSNGLNNDIRIIIVAAEYEEHVKGAAYAVEPEIQLIEYDIIGGEKKGIVFKIMVDSRRGDVIVHPPKSEDDHCKGKEHLKSLYEALKEVMLSIGSDVKVGTPTQDYIPFNRRVSFCQVHVKNKWLRLDLRNVKDFSHERIIPYAIGDWVSVHVEKKEDIEEILDVIKKAYERAA